MSDSKNYPSDSSGNLDGLFGPLDAANERLNRLKQADSDGWKTLLFKLKVDWTYHSNGIEGSAFTKGDTVFFLSEGLTVQGKSLKDHLDARNHAEAVDFLFDVVSNRREISEGLIKEINALLLHGIQSSPAVTSEGRAVRKKVVPGAYKSLPNHVLQNDGTLHRYVEPLSVQGEMEALVRWGERQS